MDFVEFITDSKFPNVLAMRSVCSHDLRHDHDQQDWTNINPPQTEKQKNKTLSEMEEALT